MFILCDTSSILMLLNINPDMFINERFCCKTIQDVYNELTRTAKFKSKYPWLRQVKSKIKALTLTTANKKIEEKYFNVITSLNDYSVQSIIDDHIIDLSYVDRKVASYTLTLRYKLTTGDRDLIQFLKQEFKDEFIGAISPLEIINFWVEEKLLGWNADRQKILNEWSIKHESPQPNLAKKRFRVLTGFKYTGN